MSSTDFDYLLTLYNVRKKHLELKSLSRKGSDTRVCSPGTPWIFISPEEEEFCRAIGIQRETHNRTYGIHDQAGPQLPMNERPDVIGSIAEYAAHKYFGIIWPATTDGPEYTGDLLGEYEIKGTYSRPDSTHKPHLISHPMTESKKQLMWNRPFILVIYQRPYAYFPGWAYGYELLKGVPEDHLGTGRVNWCLKQERLHSMKTLPFLKK